VIATVSADTANAEVQLWVDSDCFLAESPRWDARRRCLLWVDLEAGDLWSRNAVGEVQRLPLGRPTSVATPRTDGGYLTAGPRGFMWIDDEGTTLRIVDIADEDWSTMRMNDGACDPAGRMLCGSTPWKAGTVPGRLHQIDAQGQVRTLLHGLGMSNGMGWSPDGRVFYLIDSLAYTVTAFDYDVAHGTLRDARTLVTVDQELGMPDGLTVDANGGLWIAIWGGGVVLHYTADGRPAGAISVPARYVTSCTFGGPDLTDLYITTARWTLSGDALAAEPGAGGVFRCRPGVTGQPLRRFGDASTPSAW
jgi:sugar lactone lactonase YvrE